jgi:hypothetical protein
MDPSRLRAIRPAFKVPNSSGTMRLLRQTLLGAKPSDVMISALMLAHEIGPAAIAVGPPR